VSSQWCSDAQAVGLLVVGRVVLDRRADALALQALDERRAEHAGNERVLREVLEVAPAERRALDVDARAEDHVDALRARLLADRRPDPVYELGVERRAQRARGGEARGGQAAGDADMVASVGLLAQAVRAIGERDRADAGAGHRRGVPEVRSEAQRSLLFQREVHAPDPVTPGVRPTLT
jgi:hypothetical protein